MSWVPTHHGRGDSRRRHKILAVITLAVLLATVLVAWVVQYFPARRAEKAVEIIRGIRQAGLEHFWPEQSRIDWYLIELRGKLIGWRAVVRTRREGGGFAGLTLEVILPVNRFWCEKWTLNADATRGRYAAYEGIARGLRLEQLKTEIALEDGQVRVLQHEAQGRVLAARSKAPANYLPEGTMELAIRRVAEEAADAQFSLVFNEVPNVGGAVSFGVMRFRHVGTRRSEDGRTIRLVRGYARREGTHIERTYEVNHQGRLTSMYDEQRRWQPATAEEVTAAFPDAIRQLRRWLPKPARTRPGGGATGAPAAPAGEAVRRDEPAPRLPAGRGA